MQGRVIRKEYGRYRVRAQGRGRQHVDVEVLSDHPYLVGYVQPQADGYRAVSLAQQQFEREHWTRNSGATCATLDEAVAWVLAACEEVLARVLSTRR